MPSSPFVTNPNPRKAFTLVELLVSITILVILASITLYGMASVQKTAQVQRAKSQIARIHELLMERWESYETRSVHTMDVAEMVYTNGKDRPPANSLRLLGIRELMRFEFPDRISDLYPGTLPYNPNYPTAHLEGRVVLAQLPALARYYRRKADPNNGWTTEHQSAECLYLIISSISVGDANALEFFGEDEIKDTDNDGVPEIIDPWGNPIRFIRWPAGYSLSGRVTINELPDATKAAESTDPFDLLGVESLNDATNNAGRIAHAIFPLIFSWGPDRKQGLFEFTQGYSYDSFVVRRTSLSGSQTEEVFWPNDPFMMVQQGGATVQAGQLNQNKRDDSLDNITNHLISSGVK